VNCQNVITHITKLPGSVFLSFHIHSAYKDLLMGTRHSFKVNSCVSPSNAILQRPNIQKTLPCLFVEFLNFYLHFNYSGTTVYFVPTIREQLHAVLQNRHLRYRINSGTSCVAFSIKLINLSTWHHLPKKLHNSH